jgi:hypothetical protein
MSWILDEHLLHGFKTMWTRRCLGLTTGYLSRLERGCKQGNGPARNSACVIRGEGAEVSL